MADELNLNPFQFTNKGGQSELQSVDPYTRLAKGLETVFIQRGKFFGEGGPEIPNSDLPDWIETEIAKMTPRARKACGLPPEGPVFKAPEPPSKPSNDSPGDTGPVTTTPSAKKGGSTKE